MIPTTVPRETPMIIEPMVAMMVPLISPSSTGL